MAVKPSASVGTTRKGEKNASHFIFICTDVSLPLGPLFTVSARKPSDISFCFSSNIQLRLLPHLVFFPTKHWCFHLKMHS